MKVQKMVKGVTLILLALSLAACGKGGDSKKESQVAAKVDGTEITVHQLNFALAQSGVTSQEQAKMAQNQALNALINQQLLVKKAMDQKLDRDPNVLQAIEASRRQILAQAYMERMVQQQVSKPSAGDVKDYFTKHPELFEKRRIYRLQELRVAVKPENFEEIKKEAGQVKSLNDMATWLKSKNIQFAGSGGVKGAEELPPGLISQLNKMKDGQILGIPGQGSLQIIQLQASQEQPVSETQAGPAIERFITNQHRNDIIQAEVKKLRDTAKIEFLGEFIKTAETGKTAETKQSTDIPAQPQPKADSGFMEKGLSGLK